MLFVPLYGTKMIERLWRRLRNGDYPDSRAVVREMNRQYSTLRNQSDYNDAGIDIFEEDWDNLVILDACRYDAFAARSELPGTLETRYSQGSMTQEWLHANFAGRDLTDTVYISANGQFAHLNGLDAKLHAFIGVWRDDFEPDEGDPTTLASPETVTEAALTAADDYPDKRLLIHYIPPHHPYIGPIGRKKIESHLLLSELPKEIKTNPEVSRDVIRTAYNENLDIVLDEVAQLLDSLPGKTVVSADHGELLGERLPPLPLSQYGHPRGIYHEKLVHVPWHIHTNGERKEIVAEEPEHRKDANTNDDHDVEKHLKDLGYMV
jgi:hypothetical protein